MTLHQYLDDLDASFDPDVGLYGNPWHGPGYHTKVPEGTHVHETRKNLDDAALLLRSGRPEDATRAAGILRIVLPLQDLAPTSETYGIWPWLYEEPLEQMSPPDWNWADFCGSALAVILHESGDRLPDPVRADARRALDAAAASIFRRNVGPHYTNIALMGASVTAAAGEILGEPRWLEYGRARLKGFAEHTAWHGGLNEYNSPTYTLIALRECERTLQLVTDPAARETAESIRRQIWGFLAERFHPATGQLAGPHSRTYGDRLSPETARTVADLTGVAVPGAADGPQAEAASVVRHLPCPESLLSRFAELPDEVCEVRTRFIRRDPEEASTYGHTWLAADACLGSVNYDCLWVQRRPLIAYVKTDGEPAVLKASFLHDGGPCASAVVRTVQSGPRALSAFQMATDLGDFHIGLDRPENATFRARDFRIRYELAGPGVTADRSDDHLFVMNAARRRIALHAAPPRFDGVTGDWEMSAEDGRVCVDAVLWRGEERAFPFRDLGPTLIAAAVELLGPEDALESDPPAVQDLADRSTIRWRGLELVSSLRPHPYATHTL